MTNPAKHIVVLLLLLSATGLYAQPRLSRAEHYVGVHGGVMASMMSFSPTVEGTDQVLKTVLLSGNGGIRYRYVKHKYFGLQVEANYMQRGWREAWQTETEQGTYARRLDYIETPFLMHLYFGKQHRGFFNLGPQIGYCVHERHQGNRHPTEQAQYAAIDNRFDWGLAAGAGYYARTRQSGTFEFEVRFNYSLGDTFSNRKAAYFNRSAAMNLSLNLAYLWEIK